jgi:hypothetical protein
LHLLFFFETGSPYVGQTGLKLVILLSQPPKCWDYRCVPPYQAGHRFLWNNILCAYGSPLSQARTLSLALQCHLRVLLTQQSFTSICCAPGTVSRHGGVRSGQDGLRISLIIDIIQQVSPRSEMCHNAKEAHPQFGDWWRRVFQTLRGCKTRHDGTKAVPSYWHMEWMVYGGNEQ